MSPEIALLLSLAIPTVGAVVIACLGRWPNAREAASLITATALFATVVTLWKPVADGLRPSLVLAPLLPGEPLMLVLEPLGLMFMLIASLLWILTTLYSIGYMRGNKEANQTRFYTAFAVALAATMGVASAGNLVSLFLFYEALTLSTYPLVAHKGDEAAKRSGRVYLGLLLGTSIALLLLAIAWTYGLTGTTAFATGGILAGHATTGSLMLLYALFLFGIGKAALMPFHRWLPAAMVAPTPVSALLHAVAVVKAGVFAVLKISIYVFGTDLLSGQGIAEAMLWVACFTLIAASLVALSKDNLKARLAYSTISQLAYVVVGATLATGMGLMGGALQIGMHAFGKITLFFCAGAIYTAAHKTQVSQLNGLGRRMPLTFAAYMIGALSIIGLPPLGGAWSKWYLMMASAEAGRLVVMGLLMLSSLLSVAYLMPVVGRGFLLKSEDGETGYKEAPLFSLIPLCLTALGCIALFFFVEPLTTFLSPILP